MSRRPLLRLRLGRPFRRLRLSTVLITINVGLLLLTIGGMVTAATGLLERFADDQAIERVLHASVIARREVERAGQDISTSAQLLAERPTLTRLLDTEDRAGLEQFLTQFQQTSRLDGTAVLSSNEVLTRSGLDLPWERVLPALPRTATTLLLSVEGIDHLVQGAWAPLPGTSRRIAVVARLLDGSVTSELSNDIGLPVYILPARAAEGEGEPYRLRREALTTGNATAARSDTLGRYLAVVPLRAPDGAYVGLIELGMPTDSVAQSLRRLVETLTLLAVAVATLAALVSFVLGRRLGRPLYALTRAAAQIGSGDLLTPIPRATGAEIGTLATTLEEMRGRLLQLTADLRRQRAEAQAIVTGIQEGVFTVDRQRRIQYLNPQAAALLGISVDQAIGRFCGDVLRPQGPNGIRPCEEHCPIVHARFRGSARATEHLTLHSGERRTVVITSAPTNDALQVQVMRDETEIEATRRLRDTILANISHEFRTPLSAQLASIELLLDQLPDLKTEQIGQLVVALQRGTLRLTQLIDNLLESARIEAGQHAIRHRPVDVDEVVEEALELTRPLLDQRHQEVNVELPFPLPQVQGDARRLIQAFVNLLANANKYAPEASTITIGGDVHDTGITLWVEDQGPGLPTTGGPALFTRFVRSETEEPEQSGVGLGLWLVKSIVERHGGQLAAHSTPQGTRMSITLPLEQIHEDTRR